MTMEDEKALKWLLIIGGIVEVILGFFAILCLILGFLWPWLARWRKKNVERIEASVFAGQILRIVLFESLAIYSLVLGILGSDWYVLVPLFLLAAVALILTFPTKKRWVKWLEAYEGNHLN